MKNTKTLIVIVSITLGLYSQSLFSQSNAPTGPNTNLCPGTTYKYTAASIYDPPCDTWACTGCENGDVVQSGINADGSVWATVVWANTSGGTIANACGSLDVSINNIAQPSISPGGTYKLCGSSPVTFTAHVSSTANITGYTWFVKGTGVQTGTFSTTTPQFSLTPTSNWTSSSYSAQVSVGSVNSACNYETPTYPFTAQGAIPAIPRTAWVQLSPGSALANPGSISGSSHMCAGATATFTYNNAPTGITGVTWATSSNLTIISQSAFSVTVSANAAGTGTITANLNACTAVSHNVQIGTSGSIGTVTVNGSNHVCPGNQYGYTADTPGGYNPNYTYSWTYPSGWINQGQGANYINLYLPSYNTTYGYVNVTVSNSCGGSGAGASSGLTAYPSGCSQGSALSYSYYPNPASNTLTVEVASDSTSTSTEVAQTLDEPYQLSLYNSFSQPVYSTQSSSSSVQIPLEGIPSGVYYLNLHYKGAVLRKQVIIKK